MISNQSHISPSMREDLDWCRSVAARDRSALYQVSRLLSRPHRRLFDVTYTSMRLLDDAVDGGDTHDAVDEPMIWLEQWRKAMQCAFEGDIPSDIDADIHRSARSMAPIVRAGQLPFDFWDDLASALRADIVQKPMRDWTDFHHYCRGATVAPSAIFVYILTCQFDKSGQHQSPVTGLREAVTPLATYCYLVHIARDLVKDAAQGSRLITLPAQFLEEMETSPRALHELATTEPDHAVFKRTRLHLVDRAEMLRPACRDSLTLINKHTNWRARMALHLLFRKYVVLSRSLRMNSRAS